MKSSIISILFSFMITTSFAYNNNIIARHVHISYGPDPATSMVITWSTVNNTDKSLVRYGLSGALTEQQLGTATKFVDGGKAHATQYIHRVTLRNLKSGQLYYYQCGDSVRFSPVYTFRVLPKGSNFPLRFAVYGDMGVVNAQSLPRLKNDTDKYNMYDAILHVGDFAYDMADNNGNTGDRFMSLIEPIAARIPYMVSVGNHEYHYNYSNYKNRFSMPGGDGQNMFYSYNVGPIHIVSMSTEFYFYVQYGISEIWHQYKWLENDLKEASKPENRAVRPWIILVGHRPMYCTNKDHDCGLAAEYIRNGIPVIHLFGIEKLLHKYGVDISVWAHEHSYERLWPVYKSVVMNGTTTPGKPYTDSRATVHIITGSAGCSEKHDPFNRDKKPYSAFRSEDYGYSRMTVYNSTHVHWSQVSDDQNGKIVDDIWIVKHKHGPF